MTVDPIDGARRMRAASVRLRNAFALPDASCRSAPLRAASAGRAHPNQYDASRSARTLSSRIAVMASTESFVRRAM